MIGGAWIKIEIGFGFCGWIEWVGGVPDFVCFAQHDTLIGSSTRGTPTQNTEIGCNFPCLTLYM